LARGRGEVALDGLIILPAPPIFESLGMFKAAGIGDIVPTNLVYSNLSLLSDGNREQFLAKKNGKALMHRIWNVCLRLRFQPADATHWNLHKQNEYCK